MIVNAGSNQELGELLDATNKERPRKADIVKLQTYLEQHPEHAADVGNLARQIQHTIIAQSFSRASEGFGLVVAAKCAQMMTELGYTDSTPIEEMLIDHIIVCWLRLHDIEARYDSVRGEATIRQMDHWERRLTLAQHRYLRAVETLAKVRRLLRPPTSPAMALLLKQQVIGSIQNNVGR